MKRLLFIYNAKSGTGGIGRYLADVIDTFIKSGYYVDTYQTQCAGDARKQVIKRANDFDMIVCSGGDGTLNEVTSGLMRLKVRPVLGYIPTGSTNDFAVSLGLKNNIATNAKIAMCGKRYKIDVGTFNRHKHFVYIAAFGIFTEVSYNTSQKLKNVMGHPAYVVEAIKSIPSIKSYRMRFEINGKIIEDDFIYGMISNSGSVAGFKGITGDNVILDDGFYEITLLKKPKSIADLTNIAQALLDSNRKSEYVYRYKASRVKAHSLEPITWTIDGENGGTHKKVTIKNNPNAITIVGARKR